GATGNETETGLSTCTKIPEYRHFRYKTYPRTIPSCFALAIACVRLTTPSFLYIRCKCALTVCNEINSWSAVCLLANAAPTNLSTSTSRALSTSAPVQESRSTGVFSIKPSLEQYRAVLPWQSPVCA